MSEGEEALGPAKPIRPDEPDEEPPIEDKRLRVGKNVAFARRMLRTANAVLFDVDSTVIQGEGIDELAAYLGVGADVAVGGGVESISLVNMGGHMNRFHITEEKLLKTHPALWMAMIDTADIVAAEESVRRLSDIGLDDVAPSHGPALLGDARSRIARFLERR